MSKIILVAETGSDISREVAQEYGIYLIPMHVTFGNKTLDDMTFHVEDIVNYYKETGKIPKTSGCNPADFEIFDEIHEKYPDAHILYLAYSAVTTCSYQSAKIVAEGKEYITLLDTRQVSGGQGAVVIEVAKYLRKHSESEIDEVINYANELIDRAKMCFIPNNLEFLRAGGRVSNVAYLGATILNLHPTIEIIEGRLVATKKYRGKMSRICAKLLRETIDKYNLDNEIIYFIYTIGLSDEVKELVNKQANELGFKEIHWIQCNGVITTHGGPSAFGLAGFTKK